MKNVILHEKPERYEITINGIMTVKYMTHTEFINDMMKSVI